MLPWYTRLANRLFKASHLFLSRVSTLTHDIDIAILIVCLSVCPSVRNVPVSDENGLTYRHSVEEIHSVGTMNNVETSYFD